MDLKFNCLSLNTEFFFLTLVVESYFYLINFLSAHHYIFFKLSDRYVIFLLIETNTLVRFFRHLRLPPWAFLWRHYWAIILWLPFAPTSVGSHFLNSLFSSFLMDPSWVGEGSIDSNSFLRKMLKTEIFGELECFKISLFSSFTVSLTWYRIHCWEILFPQKFQGMSSLPVSF